jgi:hypothetical protein
MAELLLLRGLAYGFNRGIDGQWNDEETVLTVFSPHLNRCFLYDTSESESGIGIVNSEFNSPA